MGVHAYLGLECVNFLVLYYLDLCVAFCFPYYLANFHLRLVNSLCWLLCKTLVFVQFELHSCCQRHYDDILGKTVVMSWRDFYISKARTLIGC